jgi:hypothetical protein
MAHIKVLFTVDGEGGEAMTVQPKDFKTGSKGYYTNGKVEIDGKRYQLQVQLVEIGSKPVTAEMIEAKADAKVARAEAAYLKAQEARRAAVEALRA